MAKAQAATSHIDAKAIFASELQHLCTAVRRANARAVLSRGGDAVDPCIETSEAKQMLHKLRLLSTRELELQVTGMVSNRLRRMKKK